MKDLTEYWKGPPNSRKGEQAVRKGDLNPKILVFLGNLLELCHGVRSNDV